MLLNDHKVVCFLVVQNADTNTRVYVLNSQHWRNDDNDERSATNATKNGKQSQNGNAISARTRRMRTN